MGVGLIQSDHSHCEPCTRTSATHTHTVIAGIVGSWTYLTWVKDSDLLSSFKWEVLQQNIQGVECDCVSDRK